MSSSPPTPTDPPSATPSATSLLHSLFSQFASPHNASSRHSSTKQLMTKLHTIATNLSQINDDPTVLLNSLSQLAELVLLNQHETLVQVTMLSQTLYDPGSPYDTVIDHLVSRLVSLLLTMDGDVVTEYHVDMIGFDVLAPLAVNSLTALLQTCPSTAELLAKSQFPHALAAALAHPDLVHDRASVLDLAFLFINHSQSAQACLIATDFVTHLEPVLVGHCSRHMNSVLLKILSALASQSSGAHALVHCDSVRLFLVLERDSLDIWSAIASHPSSRLNLKVLDPVVLDVFVDRAITNSLDTHWALILNKLASNHTYLASALVHKNVITHLINTGTANGFSNNHLSLLSTLIQFTVTHQTLSTSNTDQTGHVIQCILDTIHLEYEIDPPVNPHWTLLYQLVSQVDKCALDPHIIDLLVDKVASGLTLGILPPDHQLPVLLRDHYHDQCMRHGMPPSTIFDEQDAPLDLITPFEFYTGHVDHWTQSGVPRGLSSAHVSAAYSHINALLYRYMTDFPFVHDPSPRHRFHHSHRAHDPSLSVLFHMIRVSIRVPVKLARSVCANIRFTSTLGSLSARNSEPMVNDMEDEEDDDEDEDDLMDELMDEDDEEDDMDASVHDFEHMTTTLPSSCESSSSTINNVSEQVQEYVQIGPFAFQAIAQVQDVYRALGIDAKEWTLAHFGNNQLVTSDSNVGHQEPLFRVLYTYLQQQSYQDSRPVNSIKPPVPSDVLGRMFHFTLVAADSGDQTVNEALEVPTESAELPIDKVLAVYTQLNKLYPANPVPPFPALVRHVQAQMDQVLLATTNTQPSWLAKVQVASMLPFKLRRQFYCTRHLGYARSLMHANPKAANRLGRNVHRQKVRVNRNEILSAAFQCLHSTNILEIEYHGEVGTGLGPTLEFYSLVVQQLGDNSRGVWASGSLPYLIPKPGLSIPASEIDQFVSTGTSSRMVIKAKDIRSWHVFYLLGQVMAKSILDNRVIDLPLHPVFLAHVFDVSTEAMTVEKLGSVDSQLQTSLKVLLKMRNNKEISALDLFYEYDGVELIPNGSCTKVRSTKDMKAYAQAIVQCVAGSQGLGVPARLVRLGFTSLLKMEPMAELFTVPEIQAFFSQPACTWTRADIAIKADHGYTLESPIIQWLIDWILGLDGGDLKMFLRFLTGAPRLPIGGWGALSPPFTVVRQHGNGLPSVMTCTNYLKLPPYDDRRVLDQRLRVAITEGQGCFHLS